VTSKPLALALLTALSVTASGCGVVQQGRAPAVLRIDELVGSSGAGSVTFGGYLHSDVITIVKVNNVDTSTRYSDPGRVTFSLVLKDSGVPGVNATQTDLNSVTVTHYRVVYRRTDGRNVQGVDVPYAFDSGMTVTVPPGGTGQQTFDLVRVSAKLEAPLLAMASNGEAIDVIADVTFYGKDQANNDVSATASIGITFANYGDPS
jgi:hypothetical protein